MENDPGSWHDLAFTFELIHPSHDSWEFLFIKQLIYGPKLDQLNMEFQSNSVPARQPDVGICPL